MESSEGLLEVCDYCQAELDPVEEHECPGISRIVRRGALGTLSAGDGLGQHKCKYCPSRFLNVHKFNKHVKFHLKPYQCEECPLSFATKKDYQRHIDTHSRQFTPGVECEDCGITFTRRDGMLKHQRTGKCCGKRLSQE
ncbi:hypothetical protein [Hadaka virus 1]|uniref:C2H2-type domain-containing protein n=1 Tax=Hadaka virus 1 TaxID=2703488 RepID=A0A6J4BJH8_9VIRU|nr:hypothetical protein QK729_s8gp1 [Hadaka virus 1]BBU94045.1 hypothetical protein [Hadaka virus 1]